MAFRSGRQEHGQVYFVPRDLTDKIIGRENGCCYVYFAVLIARNGVFILSASGYVGQYRKRYQQQNYSFQNNLLKMCVLFRLLGENRRSGVESDFERYRGIGI